MALDILVWTQWMATRKLPMYRPKHLVMMLVKAVFRKSGGRDFCALRTTTNQRRVPLLAMERLGVGTGLRVKMCVRNRGFSRIDL